MPRRNERAICILEACTEKQNSKKHGAVGCGAHLVFDWSRWISEAAAGSPSLSRHARGWAPFTGGSRHRLRCHGPPSTRTCTVLTCDSLLHFCFVFSSRLTRSKHKSRHIVLRNIICSRFQAQNAAVKDTRCLCLFGFLLAFAQPEMAAPWSPHYRQCRNVRSNRVTFDQKTRRQMHSVRRPQHSKSGQESHRNCHVFVASQILRNRCK